MIEYRTERVAPGNENNVCDILSSFGWQLIDSQEIYHENTEISGVEVKMYGDGLIGGFMKGFSGKDGEINVRQRKNVTNYVTLRFARDTAMPTYDRLNSLNAEFEQKLRIDEPKKPLKRTIILAVGFLVLLVSVILALVEGNSAELWEIIAIAVFSAVMIPLTVTGWIKYKRDMPQYRQIQYRLSQILEEAEYLLYGTEDKESAVS